MTRRYRNWLGLLAAAGGLAAACGRTVSAAPTPDRSSDCVEACVVEVENRSAMQLDVILRDGLSVRTLGAVSGYSTATFEVPAGISPRNVDARLTPGAAMAAAVSKPVECQFHSRGAGAAARLVCDVRRG